MLKITVVGIGPGGKEYLTPAALEAISEAKFLIGGKRNLQLFDISQKETFIIKNNLQDMLKYIKEKNSAVTVLASGDPGLFGILAYLRRHFSPKQLQVIPGISSVQLACARLALPWHDAVITSTHGRDYSDFIETVKQNDKVVSLTNPRSSPSELAKALLESGIFTRTIYLCQNLTYPDENITKYTLKELVDKKINQNSNCVMVILNE
ncbi:precorrin-6y C5,15-methyltransferase (decarboxylating) subunit CbiE [Desulfolucanica intricata]|uniref:precorrin-6y C5,15-methyltransferase (decarboxylating) subunit CbiE n=1 Tax=Desulfolucanica intricata TaxID=1285191 RepID=UPI0009ED2E58|nr:precorrin-6y C5,15-methyltransferase (decarboxylating) subunit CbiE [Desulfolucanica intricata]